VEATVVFEGVERCTDHLIMRGWRKKDLPTFAEINADQEVMRWFPATLTRAASDALARRADGHLTEHGWGLWALEVHVGPDRGRFAGFTGLAVPSFQSSFTPCVEVGWRLARWAWGRGYATEAATEALRIGFSDLGLAEIVSFTAEGNVRSRAVMERLGMSRDPDDDFDHPSVPVGSPLRRHVLYRVHRPLRTPPHP
jgi:RimJ/RimL family protein N-acetyltransferase